MRMEELPDILTAQVIAKYLQISRQTVYELLQLNTEFGGLPHFTIGISKRVVKEDFIHWIEKKRRTKSESYLKAVK